MSTTYQYQDIRDIFTEKELGAIIQSYNWNNLALECAKLEQKGKDPIFWLKNVLPKFFKVYRRYIESHSPHVVFGGIVCCYNIPFL